MPDKIPKSLHTVRVLVVMTDVILEMYGSEIAPEEALDIACIRLGYAKTPDDYALKAAALKALNPQGK
jgi:hypothetical protein